MAKNSKKIMSAAIMATAIFVECPMQQQRCRAGHVFKQGETKRIELSELTSEQLDQLHDDPYLKVTFDTDELADDGSQLSTAENRILELESQLADKEVELKAAHARIANLEQLNLASDQLLDESKGIIQEFTSALEAKEAEIAELKAAASSKAKK